MKKIKKILKNPLLPLAKIWEKCTFLIPSDKLFLGVSYFLRFHKKINWNNPITFNEKIQWLKLHSDSPLYTQMVDKYEVRKIVCDKIGEDYCVPLIGVFDSVEEIDFDSLPDRFVLKTTHDSGSVIICRDKSSFDIKKAKISLKKSLNKDYFLEGRERPYKNVNRRIIAEELLQSSGSRELNDYKFFVINGELKFVFVTSERFSSKNGVKFDWLDLDFNPLPFHSKGHATAWPRVNKPENFDDMKLVVKKLIIHDIPLLRIDLYNVDGKIYFGEYTFYHDGGLVPLEPKEWDARIGEMIELPRIV